MEYKRLNFKMHAEHCFFLFFSLNSALFKKAICHTPVARPAGFGQIDTFKLILYVKTNSSMIHN